MHHFIIMLFSQFLSYYLRHLLLQQHTNEQYAEFAGWCAHVYERASDGFLNDSASKLRKANNKVKNERQTLRIAHRVSTVGLSQLQEKDWIERGLYLQQGNEIVMDIFHAIKRMVEPAFEHIDNNFEPINSDQLAEFNGTGQDIINFLRNCQTTIANQADIAPLVAESNNLIRRIATIKRNEMQHIRATSASKKVDLVYLTFLQESQNIVAYSINLLKVNKKFQEN